MALRLSIENETNLPDGGPVTFTVAGRRTIDIGRDQHLDWTLPDSSRFISGKHCEVNYKDGGYWLRDVSSNGTFLNGAEERMRGPHRLKSGDRFIVGQYIIAASLDAETSDFDSKTDSSSPNPPAPYQELWADGRAIAPPIDPKHLRAPAEVARPKGAEFLDWAASVPQVDHRASSYANAFEQAPLPPAAEDVWGLESSPSRETFQPPAPDPPPQSPPPQFVPTRPSSGFARDAANAASSDADPPKVAMQLSPFLAPPRAEHPPQPIEPPQQVGAPDPERSTLPQSGEDEVFLRLLAKAAGLPANFFAGGDRQDLAQQLGAALRATVEGAMQLLKARNQAKQLTRSTNHTTIEATGNNPLKFSPTADDALRIIFGGRNHSYLDATETFAQTFDDLKSHQLKTYAALQHAVSRLVANLDPSVIARDLDRTGGAGILSSKKTKLWDDYRARWDANMLPESGGPIAAFMLHFADYYDSIDRPVK